MMQLEEHSGTDYHDNLCAINAYGGKVCTCGSEIGSDDFQERDDG